MKKHDPPNRPYGYQFTPPGYKGNADPKLSAEQIMSLAKREGEIMQANKITQPASRTEVLQAEKNIKTQVAERDQQITKQAQAEKTAPAPQQQPQEQKAKTGSFSDKAKAYFEKYRQKTDQQKQQEQEKSKAKDKDRER